MKAIILAAGTGSRLMPLTKDVPKCMVEYQGKPIINYILEAMEDCHLKDVAIVGGYKQDILENYLSKKDLTFFTNKDYNKTNMVSTLFQAKDFMDDDLIISYADIAYKKEVLEKLINSKGDFSVVIDRKWKELWSQRMDDPLDDAETLKIKNGNIVELGKKPNSYDDIEGQYIGLIKISKNVINKVVNFYDNLNEDQLYNGKDFNKMYMTSFIQMIIDELIDVMPVFIDGGWVEIDAIDDLQSIVV